MVKTFSTPVEPSGCQVNTSLFFIRPATGHYLPLSVFSSRLSVLGSRFSVLGSRFSVLSSRFSVLGSRFSVLSSQFSVLSSRFLVPGSWFSTIKVLSLAGIKGALKSTLMDRILKSVVVISVFQIADMLCNDLSHTGHPGNQRQAAPLLSLSRRPTVFWQFHASLSVTHHQYTEQRTRRPTLQRDTGWL